LNDLFDAKPQPVKPVEKQATFPGDPREHLCEACGKWGCFGFGVNLRAGVQGRWACRAHRDQVRDAPQVKTEAGEEERQ